MGWGGRRVNSGRKRKNQPRVAGASVLRHPSAPTANPVEPEKFDPPEDLDDAARAVWVERSPHAAAIGTLTRATAFAFARYCRIVVLERNESKGPDRAGPNHRGLMTALHTLEQGFRIAPDGRPVARVMPEPPNKLDRFRRPPDPPV